LPSFKTNNFSCSLFFAHLEGPTALCVCAWGEYCHIPHLAEVLSFVPFPLCPYCHQNRDSQISMIRRYHETDSSFSTTFFYLWISASFSLLASNDLPCILASLSNAFQKMLYLVIQCFFNCFVVKNKNCLEYSLSCSFLNLIWTKNLL